MSKHMKRTAAPRKWKVPRKTTKWVVRPNPGAHPLEYGISISYIIAYFKRMRNISDCPII